MMNISMCVPSLSKIYDDNRSVHECTRNHYMCGDKLLAISFCVKLETYFMYTCFNEKILTSISSIALLSRIHSIYDYRIPSIKNSQIFGNIRAYLRENLFDFFAMRYPQWHLARSLNRTSYALLSNTLST